MVIAWFAALLAGYDFSPDPGVRRELERIYDAAVRELT